MDAERLRETGPPGWCEAAGIEPHTEPIGLPDAVQIRMLTNIPLRLVSPDRDEVVRLPAILMPAQLIMHWNDTATRSLYDTATRSLSPPLRPLRPRVDAASQSPRPALTSASSRIAAPAPARPRSPTTADRSAPRDATPGDRFPITACLRCLIFGRAERKSLASSTSGPFWKTEGVFTHQNGKR